MLAINGVIPRPGRSRGYHNIVKIMVWMLLSNAVCWYLHEAGMQYQNIPRFPVNDGQNPVGITVV